MKVGRSFFGWLSLVLFALIPLHLSAEIPRVINYQGRVMVNGVNFHGEGLFKFALVDSSGTIVYWSNDVLDIDDTPTNAVTIFVTQGLFSVPLGDTSITNVAAFPAGFFSDHMDIYLRTWFSAERRRITPGKRTSRNPTLNGLSKPPATLSGLFRPDTISGAMPLATVIDPVGGKGHNLHRMRNSISL